jgi:hypothetical protein
VRHHVAGVLLTVLAAIALAIILDPLLLPRRTPMSQDCPSPKPGERVTIVITHERGLLHAQCRRQLAENKAP